MSLRAWHAVSLGMGVGIPVAAVLGALVGAAGILDIPGVRPNERAGAFALMAGMAVFLLAGIVYAVAFAVSISTLDLADSELADGELRQPGGLIPANHRHSGWPYKLQGVSGGKLFLTNRRLIFRCHGGHPWPYTLELPLARIAEVEAEGTFPAFVRVVCADGTAERFLVGVRPQADRYAALIQSVRDDAR